MKKLVGLCALLVALGVFAVAATGSNAAEGEGEAIVEQVSLGNGVFEATLENGGTIWYAPEGSSSKGYAPPEEGGGEIQARSKSECNWGQVCMWVGGSFNLELSWWPEFPKGCKNHENHPKLRSGTNLTGSTVTVGGTGIYLGYEGWFESTEAVTGQICW